MIGIRKKWLFDLYLQIINLGSERIRCPEALFHPALIGENEMYYSIVPCDLIPAWRFLSLSKWHRYIWNEWNRRNGIAGNPQDASRKYHEVRCRCQVWCWISYFVFNLYAGYSREPLTTIWNTIFEQWVKHNRDNCFRIFSERSYFLTLSSQDSTFTFSTHLGSASTPSPTKLHESYAYISHNSRSRAQREWSAPYFCFQKSPLLVHHPRRRQHAVPRIRRSTAARNPTARAKVGNWIRSLKLWNSILKIRRFLWLKAGWVSLCVFIPASHS